MRRFLSPIALRLLLFNVLLVFLPVAGLLSLRTLERQLLDLQERAMVQQGRLVAAALGTDARALDRDAARGLIRRLGGQSEARIRVVDRGGRVLADSATARPVSIEGDDSYPPASRRVARDSLLYRAGAWMWRWLERAREVIRQSDRTSSAVDLTPREVVQKALRGRYGAALRVSEGQRSLTLYSALPIRVDGNEQVIGAVLVSQSTSRILRALWRVRLDTVEVFALSVLAAIVLTLMMAATIARPLIRLRNEADELLDHRGRLRRTFGGSQRRDEIGDLTRALAQLTARLERHLLFVESFSADVSHEFKNPLASIRNAAELLAHTRDQQEREQLTATIEREVARLTRLLNAVREMSKVDAAVDMEAARPVDVTALLRELAADRPIDVSAPAQAVLVTASADRLAQAFGNVIDNAVSFSPPDHHVRVVLREEDGVACVRIEDDGPGIPPEHLQRVFERFFSFRPADQRDHDGLGLAISRAIVEAYGGTIRAENVQAGGARVEIRLPVAR